MRVYISFCLFIALFCNIWEGRADIGLGADSVKYLSECVVTGTLSPRSLRGIPIPTRLITKQDIVRLNPRHINDVLQMALPGVQINQHGAQTRIRMQGFDADHMLFLLDGEPIQGEGNGSVDLNRVDVNNIERIEILRGSASALYGSNAIGGVVNFITKNAQKLLSASVSSDYSSEGNRRYHTSLGPKSHGFSYYTTINHNIQASYRLPVEGPDPFDVRGALVWNLSEKLRYQSEDKRWDVSTYLYASTRTQDWDSKVKYLYDSRDFGSKLSHQFSERHSTYLSYNLSNYERQRYLFLADDDQYLSLFDLKTHRLRGQYNFGSEGEDKVFINAGADALWERVGGERIASKQRKFRTHSVALYGQAEWRILPRLSATVGFRHDIHSDFGQHFTPRLNVFYKGKVWKVRLGYSEGFRSPTTKELYMNWDHRGMFRIMGNPQLRPETSRMFSFAPEIQLGQVVNLSLQCSHNYIRGRIFIQEEEEGRVRRYRNAQESSMLWQGQLSLRWQVDKAWLLHLDYAYVRDVLTVQTVKTKQSLNASTVRPHNATAMLSYQKRWGQWGLSVDLSARFSSAVETAVFEEEDKDYKLLPYEAYTILRLGSSLDWRQKLRFTLGADNLLGFKPRYINESSSLSPGRTFFTSLSITL